MIQKNNYVSEIVFISLLILFIILLIGIVIYPFIPLLAPFNGILITAAFILLYLYISFVGAIKQPVATIEGVWYNEDNEKFISIDRDENELLTLKGIIKSDASNLKKMKDGNYYIISKETPSGLEFVENVNIQYDKENDQVTINSIGLSNVFTRTTNYKIPNMRANDYFILDKNSINNVNELLYRQATQ